jgi:hypothetical protein
MWLPLEDTRTSRRSYATALHACLLRAMLLSRPHHLRQGAQGCRPPRSRVFIPGLLPLPSRPNPGQEQAHRDDTHMGVWGTFVHRFMHRWKNALRREAKNF